MCTVAWSACKFEGGEGVFSYLCLLYCIDCSVWLQRAPQSAEQIVLSVFEAAAVCVEISAF